MSPCASGVDMVDQVSELAEFNDVTSFLRSFFATFIGWFTFFAGANTTFFIAAAVAYGDEKIPVTVASGTALFFIYQCILSLATCVCVLYYCHRTLLRYESLLGCRNKSIHYKIVKWAIVLVFFAFAGDLWLWVHYYNLL